MNEADKKKKVEPKRKLALSRETLRTLEGSDLKLLDGAVGGTYSSEGDSRIMACFEP
jgi:hypothetical protein